MSRYRLVLLLLSLAAAWPSAAFAQRATPGLYAERFESRLVVHPNGDLGVREDIAFRFSERAFQEVERRVPTRFADDIVEVEASLDGEVLTEGKEVGQVEIVKRDRELKVLWRFPKTTGTTRTFTLKYRAVSALRLEHGRARLAWHVLPTRHRYEIGEAHILFQSAPMRPLDGPSLDREGWTWSPYSGAILQATRADVAVDETAILSAELPQTATMTLSQWQANDERARELAPAFIVGAVIILVMGAGIIAMMFLRYHRQKVERRDAMPAARDAMPAARDAMPPGLGTGLTGGRPRIGLAQVSATLFDLLSRRVLTLEETSKESVRESARTFALIVPDSRAVQHARLQPHEQVVVDALRLKARDHRIDLKKGQQQLFKAHRKFAKAAHQELADDGLVDPERQWAARGLTMAGLVTLVIGVAGFVFAGVFSSRVGDALHLVPASVLVLGAAFAIVGQVFPTLSGTGAIASAQWAARQNDLKQMSKLVPDSQAVERWLPVAIGFGVAKAFAKSGAAVSWLSGVRNPSSALPIIIAINSSLSASSYGGSGVSTGGAAGGGGFSGAR